jgi:DNA-binding transcriptional LysR family regulator
MIPPDSGEIEAGPIRVLLSSAPSALSQQINWLIEQQPDMRLVGEVDDRIQLLVAAAMGVDVVIIVSDNLNPPPGIGEHLLGEFPDLRIVVMSPGGERATLYWNGLRRRRLNVSLPNGLATGIRRAHSLNPMA